MSKRTTDTIYIIEEHLGDEATVAQAVCMMECLQERGHDVVYGYGPSNRNANDIPAKDWEECLDIAGKK